MRLAAWRPLGVFRLGGRRLQTGGGRWGRRRPSNVCDIRLGAPLWIRAPRTAGPQPRDVLRRALPCVLGTAFGLWGTAVGLWGLLGPRPRVSG